ncbi:MAG TPA: SdpI family protein [Allosphingosinicella sp.]|jgi:uncharacterized membrane protein
MTRNTLALSSVFVVATMLVVSLAVGSGLPPDLRLPTHWGLSGEPDSFASKWVALLIPAGVTAAVSLLFHVLPALEPRREGLERSQGLYLWGWAALLGMGSAIELAVVSTALDWDLRANSLIVGATGLMLVLIGNQLGKSRSMYLIGLRTPWTLASEDVWIKTHRLGGKLMVGGGFALVAAALVPLPSGLMATVVVAVIAVAAGVPIVYSFLLWRREQDSGQPSG